MAAYEHELANYLKTEGCNALGFHHIGTSVDNVRVVFADTLFCPFFPGSTSSRTTYFLGNAIRVTAQRLKKRLYDRVAGRFGVPAEELEVKGGQVYVRREPDKKMMYMKTSQMW